MSPVSPFPALAAIFLAVTASLTISRYSKKIGNIGRYASIDGLRGYLAFFVFLHHSAVWYFYSKNGGFHVPPSRLYTHFGQSSVALFFMITGFLFFSKLIDGRWQKINWLKLYVSRIFRIAPLYLFAIFLLFAIVAFVSGGVLIDQPMAVTMGCIRWLGLGVLGGPTLNHVEYTSTIIAGVTWSLRYEWLFYFSLPIFAIFTGARTSGLYLFFGVSAVLAMTCTDMWKPDVYCLVSFVGGVAASLAVRSELLCSAGRSRLSSIVIIVCLSCVLLFRESAYDVVSICLLSIAFIGMACGNNIFGILTHPASRILGEMSYSMYMLHGIVLFTTFHFVVGEEKARMLSPIQHWAIVISVVPILTILCFVTFRFIEYPAIRHGAVFSEWLRSAIERRYQTAMVHPKEMEPQNSGVE